MRRSTRYPFKYTWTKLLADLFWLTLLLSLLVKVIESITFEPVP